MKPQEALMSADRNGVGGDAGDRTLRDGQNAGYREHPAQHHDLKRVREQTGGGWVDKWGDEQRDDAAYTKERRNDPYHFAHVDLDLKAQV